MARNIKDKVIQIQKPAQSLEAFKAKAAVPDTGDGLLKPVAIGMGAVVLAIVLLVGFRSWRRSGLERHETAVAEIQLAVQGDGQTPRTPADTEKRMREQLPRLEALAKDAPSSRRDEIQAMVAAWKLQLEGKGGIQVVSKNPWDLLRLAQRQVALAQGQEALNTLAPLRKKADASVSWGSLYWQTLLEADRVVGNREQAWKDIAEYKQRFKDQANAASLERLIAGI